MNRLRAWVEDFGRMILFGGETLAWVFRPPFRPELILAQMAAIGVGSVFIVGTTGFFTGMVFALQVTYAMGQFGAEGYVGGSVGLALSRELAPVLTALMVIGRSGSAITTELGTMRVTEQIDAMETMAVNPVQYLAVPRLLAALFMFPALTMLFNSLGYLGGYLMGVFVSNIPPGPFIEHTRTMVETQDITHGLFKAFIFGGVVAVITTYRGYAAEPAAGSRGVGEGTTRAVVMSSIATLVFDYVLTLGSVGK
ncbi:MlaE family ABC transporter permease [Anaeromyxobacter diazotrophicus]|uniref:ABC transporter permease n=1 Tax=Anaeromyxobacter diazotrophicus TaxID=2590199 RepID=A0A7I9VLU4_9BACT|nr:ABC transporter permease [Anaeromyxobacter diazotrophicus]GEJ57382.1 ABC transporter permease [Anaeromyxobacter diazotrophicus]